MVSGANSPDEEYFLQQLDSPVAFRVAEESVPSAKAAALLSAQSSASLPSIAARTVNVPETLLKDHHNATITSTSSTNPSALGEFPVYLVVLIALVSFVMTSSFFYFLCRCLVRKKKRENQLADLTPKRAMDPRMAGVRANQPIQFVVPTTTAVVLSETVTTEDSVSETDYSSSGAKTLPHFVDRSRRKRSGFQINPADLQHGLYVGVTAASEKGGAFLGDLGKVGFSLRYNLQRSQLTVKIIGAKDLPCHLLRTTASPFVKLVLLPDKTAKFVTRVLKNTANPAFDESFAFCVRRDDLPDKRLKISVWDYDRFSRKCLVGQLIYSLRDSGLTNSSLSSVEAETGEIWADLKQESATPLSENVEVLLSLCYDPDPATLTLTVLKVRGLDVRHEKAGKETSIYAKVTLYVRRKLVRTKKTPSRKKSPVPVEFNVPFSIHVPQAALPQVDLTVSVCERWPLGGKRVLGRTQAGANCLCEQGLQHWQDMLASPKSTCAQWHALCG